MGRSLKCGRSPVVPFRTRRKRRIVFVSSAKRVFNPRLPDPPPELFVCLCATQDQRLKEMGMQTPPSASPSSQAMNSANNNHIAHTPELFPYSLSANRYSPSPLTAPVVAPPAFICAVSLRLPQRSQPEQ